MLMTAALTDELSRLPLTNACCRRAETITLLRFAGAVHQEPARWSIEVDLDTTLVARRLGIAIRALYGYPTQLHMLPTPGYPTAPRHRLRMTRQVDAVALARRTGLADPRGRLIHGLPAPIVAAGVCDAAAIWRGAFLVAGSLTEPHRFPALDIVCPSLEAAMALTGAARRLGITTKTKHLRGVDRVTVREPDAITALPTHIGAPDTAATWARDRTHHQEHTPSPRLPGFDDANHTRARFTRSASHPTYQAMLEVGRAQRTIFVARYLRSRQLQREITEGLNVVEAFNRANSVIYYGKGDEIASNRQDEQEMTVLSLRILQAALVYVYTLMLQDILAEDDWAELLTPEDRRGLTPLFWHHVLPYGEVKLDLTTRLSIRTAAPASGP